MKKCELAPGLAPDAVVQSIQREVDVLLTLRHPNIVTVYGYATQPDRSIHIVMALAPGGSLARKLTGRPLPLADVCRYGMGVACGLAHMHSRVPALTHNDIKPDNVLLTADDQVYCCSV